jgi:hypothetical protein
MLSFCYLPNGQWFRRNGNLVFDNASGFAALFLLKGWHIIKSHYYHLKV